MERSAKYYANVAADKKSSTIGNKILEYCLLGTPTDKNAINSLACNENAKNSGACCPLKQGSDSVDFALIDPSDSTNSLLLSGTLQNPVKVKSDGSPCLSKEDHCAFEVRTFFTTNCKNAINGGCDQASEIQVSYQIKSLNDGSVLSGSAPVGSRTLAGTMDKAACEQLSGIWDAVNLKCQFTSADIICSQIGGVWDVNSTPKCKLPGSGDLQAQCISLGGEWKNSSCDMGMAICNTQQKAWDGYNCVNWSSYCNSKGLLLTANGLGCEQNWATYCPSLSPPQVQVGHGCGSVEEACVAQGVQYQWSNGKCVNLMQDCNSKKLAYSFVTKGCVAPTNSKIFNCINNGYGFSNNECVAWGMLDQQCADNYGGLLNDMTLECASWNYINYMTKECNLGNTSGFRYRGNCHSNALQAYKFDPNSKQFLNVP